MEPSQWRDGNFFWGGSKGIEFLFQYDLPLLVKDIFVDVITVGEFV